MKARMTREDRKIIAELGKELEELQRREPLPRKRRALGSAPLDLAPSIDSMEPIEISGTFGDPDTCSAMVTITWPLPHDEARETHYCILGRSHIGKEPHQSKQGMLWGDPVPQVAATLFMDGRPLAKAISEMTKTGNRLERSIQRKRMKMGDAFGFGDWSPGIPEGWTEKRRFVHRVVDRHPTPPGSYSRTWDGRR